MNFIHIHLLSLLMAAQASTALPGPLKQKVRKRYVVHLICNIMFAVGNRTRVYRAELNCAHRTHQCTNHVPKARPLPRVFPGGCVGAIGQTWRCPSQPAEAGVLLPLGRLQSFNLFLHCWAGSLLTTFFIQSSNARVRHVLPAGRTRPSTQHGPGVDVSQAGTKDYLHPHPQPFFCDPISSGHNLE